MSQTFCWDVRFLSAPMLSEPVHLDALLWAALVRCGVAPEQALEEIPLDQVSDGVFAGSSGLCVGASRLPPVGRPTPLVRTARPVDAQDVGVKTLPKSLVSTYPVLGATEMMFVGRGDLEMVNALLEGVDGIGKRVHQGLGEIDKERSHCFSIGDVKFPVRWANGQPTRNMPWDLFVGLLKDDTHPLDDVCKGIAPYQIPYWQQNQTDETVAVATHGYMRREIFMDWLKECAR